MTLRLVYDPNVVDFAVLAHSMRADEIEQFMAMSGVDNYDPEIAARAFINAAGPKFLLVDEHNAPVLLGGFVPVGPGNFEAWMCGTDAGWATHWRTFSRVARKVIDGKLADDARRVQIICLASRTRTQQWYQRALGMRFEGILTAYCGNGADAAMYAKTRG